MMTDPIADMLTRIRNANVAMHDEVRMPASKQKVALATILQQEGYISGYAVAPSTTRPGRRADHQHEVLAGPRPQHQRPAPGVQARPAPVRQGGQGARACWAAWVSLCSRPARVS